MDATTSTTTTTTTITDAILIKLVALGSPLPHIKKNCRNGDDDDDDN